MRQASSVFSHIHGHEVVCLDSRDCLFLDTLRGALLFFADTLMLEVRLHTTAHLRLHLASISVRVVPAFLNYVVSLALNSTDTKDRSS